MLQLYHDNSCNTHENSIDTTNGFQEQMCHVVILQLVLWRFCPSRSRLVLVWFSWENWFLVQFLDNPL